ncbi:hypothetical protein LMIY3S_00484 [Labrys miyagiensis]
MKTLLLGLGLLAATVMPALADGAAPGWAPANPVPPSYFHPPGYTPTPLFLPAKPGPTLPGFPDVRASPVFSLRPPPQNTGPMKVIIVRSNATGCADHCAEWISAEGRIQADTAPLFRKALAAMGSRKLPILISSSGGQVQASLSIGRMIRAKGLDVVVGRSTLVPCRTEDKACSDDELLGRKGSVMSFTSFCASACANILAGGMRRIVPHSSLVGVHDMLVMRFWHTVERIPVRNPFGQYTGYRTKVIDSPSWPEPASPGQYKILQTYFREMGIKESIVDLMHLATPEQMHWLTAQELGDTGLATETLASEDYIGAIDHPGAQSPVSGVPPVPAPTTPAPPAPLVQTVAPVQPVQTPPPMVASSPAVPTPPGPLDVRAVQTQAAHVPAGSLLALPAPADSDAAPVFAAPPAGVLQTSQPSLTTQSPPPAAPSPSSTRLAAIRPASLPAAKPPKAGTAAAKPAGKTPAPAQPARKPAAACSASIRTVPAAGRRLSGEVRVVMSPAAGSMMLQRVEETTHVQASPKYFGYQRLGIWVYSDGIPEPGTAIAPHGLNVQPGDLVTIVTRHQDAALPCHFVPNLVVAVRHKA